MLGHYLEDSGGEVLSSLCDTGGSSADGYLEAEFKRLAGDLLSDIFIDCDVFTWLMPTLNKRRNNTVVHGYEKDEYILCGGSDI